MDVRRFSRQLSGAEIEPQGCAQNQAAQLDSVIIFGGSVAKGAYLDGHDLLIKARCSKHKRHQSFIK
jgi:hypothetical protein